VRFVGTPGTTEFVNRWDPKPGDIVSFKHSGFLLSSKKPKFPLLYRLRPDLTWQTVADNWKESKPSRLPGTSSMCYSHTQSLSKFTPSPQH